VKNTNTTELTDSLQIEIFLTESADATGFDKKSGQVVSVF
jgi:hypothetical protein